MALQPSYLRHRSTGWRTTRHDHAMTAAYSERAAGLAVTACGEAVSPTEGIVPQRHASAKQERLVEKTQIALRLTKNPTALAVGEVNEFQG